MSATTTRNAGTSAVSMSVKLPAHPTYNLKSVIQLVQSEDASDLGDMTCKTTIPLEKEAHFLVKEDGIVAGIALADMVFDEVDPSLKSSGIERKVIMYTKACNLVKYMAMADAARLAYILETRKTVPGLRLMDKWAVETRTLDEVNQVLHYASTTKTSLTIIIMLDNMVVPLSNGDVDISMLKEAVKLIEGRFETEAFGIVTLENVNKIGQSGVTYISSGALTHSVKALDISLKIDTELALEVGKRTKRA